MVNGGGPNRGDESGFADVPWGSVFDPEVNLKAAGAVQQRGFRAATIVVNRLVQISAQLADSAVRSPDAPSGNPSGVQADAGEPRDGSEDSAAFDSRADAEHVIRLWRNLLDQFSGSLRGSRPHQTDGEAAQFDFAAARSHGQVRIVGSGSGPICAEMWLHNRGADDLGEVRLRCSDLLAHDGALIRAEAVRFDPGVPSLPGRCSRGVTVGIDLDEDTRPGIYRGTLLADGHQDVWLPVVVVLGAGTP